MIPPIMVASNIKGLVFKIEPNNLKPDPTPSITGLSDTSIPINEDALACACSISSALYPNSEPNEPTTPVANANPPAIPCPTFSICSPFFCKFSKLFSVFAVSNLGEIFF